MKTDPATLHRFHQFESFNNWTFGIPSRESYACCPECGRWWRELEDRPTDDVLVRFRICGACRAGGTK